MQVFDLPKGEAGDWKSRRELFGAVKKTAQFVSAPIFAKGEIFQEKIDSVEDRGGLQSRPFLAPAPKISQGLPQPLSIPRQALTPAPNYF